MLSTGQTPLRSKVLTGGGTCDRRESGPTPGGCWLGPFWIQSTLSMMEVTKEQGSRTPLGRVVDWRIMRSSNLGHPNIVNSCRLVSHFARRRAVKAPPAGLGPTSGPSGKAGLCL